MATQPRFTSTCNLGRVSIPTANAQVKSDGTSAGVGADMMYKLLTAGANDTLVDAVRFHCVASAAAVASVATTLRVYVSTVATPGATTAADTFLLGEVSVPAITASHSTNATNYFDCVINKIIPAGTYLHVSQHVAQTANQNWIALGFAGDF